MGCSRVKQHFCRNRVYGKCTENDVRSFLSFVDLDVIHPYSFPNRPVAGVEGLGWRSTHHSLVCVRTRWWWWKLLLRAHVGVVARLTALEACDSRALKWWPWLSHDNPLRLSRVGWAGSEAWRSLGMRNPSDSTFWHPNAALLRSGGCVGDRKSTRLNSSHSGESRMPSSA